MLRKIRIILAALFFIGITLLFLGLAGVLEPWLGWMPKIQFLPAFLAVNVGVIAALLLLTFIFGRIYCSVICPMGVYQDIISWLSARRKGKKARFRFGRELKVLRYGVWVLFVIALVAGVHAFVSILAPYSAYGRMVRTFFGGDTSLPVLTVAICTFVVITVLAWIGGRTYCNAICPVGTTLSFVSRFALLRPVFDKEKCVRCHSCERRCKAHCIDVEKGEIDHSRCVVCFDCIGACKPGGLKYKFAYGKKEAAAKPSGKPADASRRAFMAGTAVAATGAAAAKAAATVTALTAAVSAGAQEQEKKRLDGGLAEILPKKSPQRTAPITPFGSESAKHFYQHCTACQLCVTACPNNVLRPSVKLDHLMQPEMGYENGYCRPECTKCSEVCPAGAILPITAEEKTAIHVGTATVDYDLCVVNRDGVSCGNCARHCPAGAIMMVRKDKDDPDSLMIPTVNEARCIGCGACENLCPSRPLSAIHVNGLQVHIKD